MNADRAPQLKASVGHLLLWLSRIFTASSTRESPQCVCVLVFIVTVAIAPMSKLFIVVAIGVGILDAIISMEELTGGNRLSWLSIPLILGGDFFAYGFSVNATTRTQSWALVLQFLSVVFFTESLVIIVFRSRLEAFNAERNTR